MSDGLKYEGLEIDKQVYDPGEIIFKLSDQLEIMRFESNGDIFVKGNLIENDHEVVDAFREWLASTKSGHIAERENRINALYMENLELKKEVERLLGFIK